MNGFCLTARSQETTELKTLWYFWDASPSPLLSLVPSWIYSNASFDSARLRRRRDTLRLDSARVTAFLPDCLASSVVQPNCPSWTASWELQLSQLWPKAELPTLRFVYSISKLSNGLCQTRAVSFKKDQRAALYFTMFDIVHVLKVWLSSLHFLRHKCMILMITMLEKIGEDVIFTLLSFSRFF